MSNQIDLSKVHPDVTPEIQSQIQNLIDGLEAYGVNVSTYTNINPNLPISLNENRNEITIFCTMEHYITGNHHYKEMSAYFCVEQYQGKQPNPNPWWMDEMIFDETEETEEANGFHTFKTYQEVLMEVVDYLI